MPPLRLAKLARHMAASSMSPLADEPRRWWDSVAGTKHTYIHPLVGGAEAFAPGRGLPTLVVCGTQPGPTLLVTAGVHGDEYEAMAALHQVYATADPAQLRGTLVLVSCANVDAFLGGVREGVVDGANLARVFPGDASGTLTERVAATLMRDFLEKKPDLYCDLHSAGRIMRMIPVCGCKCSSATQSTNAPVFHHVAHTAECRRRPARRRPAGRRPAAGCTACRRASLWTVDRARAPL